MLKYVNGFKNENANKLRWFLWRFTRYNTWAVKPNFVPSVTCRLQVLGWFSRQPNPQVKFWHRAVGIVCVCICQLPKTTKFLEMSGVRKFMAGLHILMPPGNVATIVPATSDSFSLMQMSAQARGKRERWSQKGWRLEKGNGNQQFFPN